MYEKLRNSILKHIIAINGSTLIKKVKYVFGPSISRNFKISLSSKFYINLVIHI